MTHQIDSTTTERERKQRNKTVQVARTRVGKGVFAQRRYQPDAVIGQIQGEIISDPEYGSDYCFNLEDGRRLEPSPPFRYVNHSCDPNCEFDFFDGPVEGDAGAPRLVFLFALREIRPGEELTIDYNWSATAAIPCRCQSPRCRGWIVAQSELPALQ